jgi:hypothetical protein
MTVVENDLPRSPLRLLIASSAGQQAQPRSDASWLASASKTCGRMRLEAGPRGRFGTPARSAARRSHATVEDRRRGEAMRRSGLPPNR